MDDITKQNDDRFCLPPRFLVLFLPFNWVDSCKQLSRYKNLIEDGLGTETFCFLHSKLSSTTRGGLSLETTSQIEFNDINTRSINLTDGLFFRRWPNGFAH